MNHPEITKMNARMYHGKALKEAEEYRKTRKVAKLGPIAALLSALSLV